MFFLGNKYPMDILQKVGGTRDSQSLRIKKMWGIVLPVLRVPLPLGTPTYAFN